MRSNNRKRVSKKRGGSPGSSRVNSFVPSCNTQADSFEQFYPKGTANISPATYYRTSGGGKHKQLGGNLPYNRIFSQLSSCLDNNANSSYDNAPADLQGDLGTNYFSVSNGQNGGRRRKSKKTKRARRSSSKRRSVKRGGSCGAPRRQNGGRCGGNHNKQMGAGSCGAPRRQNGGRCGGNHNKQMGAGSCGAARRQNGGRCGGNHNKKM